MAFRTVLFVIGVDHDPAEVDRAADIAEGFGAHLTILALGVAPPPPASPYGVVSSDLWAAEIGAGQEAAQAAADAVQARLADRGVSMSAQAQYVDRATVATLVARFARYADVTLITPQSEGAALMQGSVLNGALFESGRPVVVLPQGPVAFPAVRRVMIAWDASVEASKAVRDSIELMQAADTVQAVLIDPIPSFEGHGPEPGADLATYLGRHGISLDVRRLPKEGKEVADVLQRAAVDLDADLIVMGGFGHSRLRQRIFGGTTTSTFKETSRPVLMAH